MPDHAPDFVYVTYIAASIDDVWKGLTDRQMTQAYWQHYNVSDWTPGARWEHVTADGNDTVEIVGEVVEVEPPRRLVVTWALPKDAGDESQTSRVTFDLEALGPDTRLTVTHSELSAGSVMHEEVSAGWPAVLSNLKTLLETGRILSEAVEDSLRNG